MNSLLYDIFLLFLKTGIYIASIFNPKAKLRFDGNSHWKTVINHRNKNHKLAWFHCASLGEFEQGRPVMEDFRKNYPQFQILVTFFSPSGFEIRKNYSGADIITYLPLDIKSDVIEFLNAFQPDIAFFIKYEFWRNFIREIKKRNIPLISFSTIFRKNQINFKPWGGFARKTIQKFDHIFVQNQLSAELLKSINYQKLTIAGDTRFDRVNDTLKNIKPIPEAENFKMNEKVLVAGSVWPEDLEVLIPLINSDANLKFIIAPHEIHQKEITSWRKRILKKSINFSEIKPESVLADFEVLFIDNIGMLSSLYQYGNMAFIGGAYGKGLHNILEAVTFGLPVFFGNKNFTKFQEANDLVESKGAFAIEKPAELISKTNEFLNNGQLYNITKTHNQEYIKNHTGATDVILDWIDKQIM